MTATATKGISKAQQIRDYAKEYPEHFRSMSNKEVAEDIGGKINAIDVAMTRAKLTQKGAKVAKAKKVVKPNVNKSLTSKSVALETRLGIQLPPNGSVTVVLNDENGRVIGTISMSKEGLTLKRANKKNNTGHAKWESMFRMVEAGFLS